MVRKRSFRVEKVGAEKPSGGRKYLCLLSMYQQAVSFLREHLLVSFAPAKALEHMLEFIFIPMELLGSLLLYFL